MELTFAEACALLETALAGNARRMVVEGLTSAADLRGALLRLRDSMRSNTWRTDASQLRLDRFVSAYDRRTRGDGFHALHDWNGKADAVNAETIPVDVLNYVA